MHRQEGKKASPAGSSGRPGTAQWLMLSRRLPAWHLQGQTAVLAGLLRCCLLQVFCGGRVRACSCSARKAKAGLSTAGLRVALLGRGARAACGEPWSVSGEEKELQHIPQPCPVTKRYGLQCLLAERGAERCCLLCEVLTLCFSPCSVLLFLLLRKDLTFPEVTG